VLVITHRHRDHLAAFQDDEAAAIFDTMRPKLIVRPWADHPDADADATHLGPESRSFARTLREGQNAAQVIGAAFSGPQSADSLRGELRDLAKDQIANADAVERLETYAAEADAEYLAYGDDSKIPGYIPGIGVDVVGPPTVEQWPEVTHQAKVNQEEFWMLTSGLAATTKDNSALVASDPDTWAPLLDEHRHGPARWLLERLDDQRAGSLLRIVRTFDDALNNTSLILLIEAGDRRMLFTGDAQIENWNYVLKGDEDEKRRSTLCAKLSEVDLYKVGHHGSRNATPRSLFNLWDAGNHPMVCLLSTLPGFHGKTVATAVPRATLLHALRRRSNGHLYSTDELPAATPFLHLEASAGGSDPFAKTI
jgi:hypothetical protein